jgi:uracil-DNA glycosylase family 4
VSDARDVKLSILNCERCELHERASAPVSFSGPNPNPFVIIGEAPGASEDRRGRPFVGPAGTLLRKAVDIAFGEKGYADIFSYLNVVSCFPNGTPRPKHVRACSTNLEAQLEVLSPRYGILCGGVALNAFWPRSARSLSITQYRGAWLEVRRDWGVLFLRAVWHPAAVLREGGLGTTKGQELVEDLREFAGVALKFLTPATDLAAPTSTQSALL